MKNYFAKHHMFFGGLGALIALVVAAVYLVVIPEESFHAPWALKIILSYGHFLCWLLLAVASAAWSIKRNNRWSISLAYLGLADYVIFISTLLLIKST